MDDSPRTSLPGRALARNSVWNFVGLVTPMIIGLFIIPLLIDGMGKERFGLLTIIWMGVGYFGLFDMGLGRALTKLVAERSQQDEELPAIIYTALFFVFGLGLIAVAILWLVSDFAVTDLLKAPVWLRREGASSLRVLAVSIPIVVTTSALVGILEGNQRFSWIAVVRVPLGAMTFIGPLISLRFSSSLLAATLILVVTRTLAFVVFSGLVFKTTPALKQFGLKTSHLLPLIRFGGWLTVSNVVGPLMVYCDRFLIGALLGLAAVTYYTTPFEVLMRVQIIPQSILGVLFPAIATVYAVDRGRIKTLYQRVSSTMFLLMLPLMSTAALLAPEALELWVGREFSINATPVVQWLALGWLLNSVARPASATLQGIGRPDVPAKFHLAEVIPYACVLFGLTRWFGIAGAATAWCLRIGVDSLVLTHMTGRLLPEVRYSRWRVLLLFVALPLAFVLATRIPALWPRLGIGVLVVTTSAWYLWNHAQTLFGVPGVRISTNS